MIPFEADWLDGAQATPFGLLVVVVSYYNTPQWNRRVLRHQPCRKTTWQSRHAVLQPSGEEGLVS
jgi:hypothetical protein